jgi:hypothetical protein
LSEVEEQEEDERECSSKRSLADDAVEGAGCCLIELFASLAVGGVLILLPTWLLSR